MNAHDVAHFTGINFQGVSVRYRDNSEAARRKALRTMHAALATRGRIHIFATHHIAPRFRENDPLAASTGYVACKYRERWQ